MCQFQNSVLCIVKNVMLTEQRWNQHGTVQHIQAHLHLSKKASVWVRVISILDLIINFIRQRWDISWMLSPYYPEATVSKVEHRTSALAEKNAVPVQRFWLQWVSLVALKQKIFSTAGEITLVITQWSSLFLSASYSRTHRSTCVSSKTFTVMVVHFYYSYTGGIL